MGQLVERAVWHRFHVGSRTCDRDHTRDVQYDALFDATKRAVFAYFAWCSFRQAYRFATVLSFYAIVIDFMVFAGQGARFSSLKQHFNWKQYCL